MKLARYIICASLLAVGAGIVQISPVSAQLQIVQPLAITSPKSNARVNSPLVVKGSSSKNQTVEVNVQAVFSGGEQDLGTFKSKADNSGNWQTTPINLWLPEGAKNAKYLITAKVGNQVTTATVLPPQNVVFRKVQKLPTQVILNNLLSITSHQANDYVSSPLVVEGRSVGGSVDVHVKATFSGGERDLGTFHAEPAGDRGQWKTNPIALSVPANASNVKYVVTATQVNNGKQGMQKSVTLRQKLSAAQIPMPKITSPSPSGNVGSGDTLVVRGMGLSGANNSVEVTVRASWKEWVGGTIKSGAKVFANNQKANFSGQINWQIPNIKASVPATAFDIQYTAYATQVLDGMRSNKAVAATRGRLQPTSTPSIKINGSGGGKKTADITGKGNPGWKVDVVLAFISGVNGEVTGHRYGTATVDNNGNWKVNVGWDDKGVLNPTRRYKATATHIAPDGKKASEVSGTLDPSNGGSHVIIRP